MKSLEKIKEKIRLSPIWSFIVRYKANRLEAQYRRIRERYFAIAAGKGGFDFYKQTRSTVHREIGRIHTFALVRQKTWEKDLVGELKFLGPVTIFDFTERGFDESIQTTRSAWIKKRKEENEALIEVLRRVHKENPIDWVFSYFNGYFILKDTIEIIKNELKIPTVNVCFDDKHSWAGIKLGKQRTGQIDLAGVFDLSWTSSRVAVDWYNAEGGRGIYMPVGFNPENFYPTQAEFDIPVSFVGACYGVRPLLVKFLRRHGVAVKVYGHGWNGWSYDGFIESINDIYNKSQINLGCQNVAHSFNLSTLKGREFDVAVAGGGVCLTDFNSDLAQHFHIGREILCYRNFDECLELIRYYLARPQDCRAIAQRARERCLKEHRWLHRYIKICQTLGILEE